MEFKWVENRVAIAKSFRKNHVISFFKEKKSSLKTLRTSRYDRLTPLHFQYLINVDANLSDSVGKLKQNI